MSGGCRAALPLLAAASLLLPACAPASARGAARADASALYNAGTTALGRDGPGAAMAFLLAAERLDPRAADVHRNLAEARARAAAARGAGEPGPSPRLPISTGEGFWLSAILLAAGAAASIVPLPGAGRPGRRPGTGRALRRGGHVAVGLGLIAGLALALHAREEAVHPEAVVVVPSLPVGPAPDERPRPPYLLGAGEVVRLGRERGALVEIRVDGTAIGWAERAGVWRVVDAPRYTPPSPRS